jgi:hypothetical protein
MLISFDELSKSTRVSVLCATDGLAVLLRFGLARSSVGRLGPEAIHAPRDIAITGRR